MAEVFGGTRRDLDGRRYRVYSESFCCHVIVHFGKRFEASDCTVQKHSTPLRAPGRAGCGKPTSGPRHITLNGLPDLWLTCHGKATCCRSGNVGLRDVVMWRKGGTSLLTRRSNFMFLMREKRNIDHSTVACTARHIQFDVRLAQDPRNSLGMIWQLLRPDGTCTMQTLHQKTRCGHESSEICILIHRVRTLGRVMVLRCCWEGVGARGPRVESSGSGDFEGLYLCTESSAAKNPNFRA